jgi:hypothetical protein
MKKVAFLLIVFTIGMIPMLYAGKKPLTIPLVYKPDRDTLKDRNDKVLYVGVARGNASNFGRSYKAENYQEVLSTAILNMVAALVKQEGFLRALRQ